MNDDIACDATELAARVRRGEVQPTDLAQLADTSLERTPNTPLFNQTGQPAVSLPLYQTPEGLPIGVQFVARYAEEPLLVRVASQIEEARPWKDRRPRVLAS